MKHHCWRMTEAKTLISMMTMMMLKNNPRHDVGFLSWPLGYIAFSMLNSAEHEIKIAH